MTQRLRPPSRSCGDGEPLTDSRSLRPLGSLRCGLCPRVSGQGDRRGHDRRGSVPCTVQPQRRREVCGEGLVEVVGHRNARPLGRDPRSFEDGDPVAPGGDRLAVPERPHSSTTSWMSVVGVAPAATTTASNSMDRGDRQRPVDSDLAPARLRNAAHRRDQRSGDTKCGSRFHQLGDAGEIGTRIGDDAGPRGSAGFGALTLTLLTGGDATPQARSPRRPRSTPRSAAHPVSPLQCHR